MGQASPGEESERAVRKFVEALNRGSVDHLSDGFVEHDRSHGGGSNDVGEVEATVARLTEALSEFELTIERLLADGDRVAVDLTASGVHDGELHGVEPTGERVEYAMMIFARVEDREIAESWVLRDEAGIASQLGVPPER